MIAVQAPGPEAVFLRPADWTDARQFLSWRNDPWIVSKGKSNTTVSESEHLAWFSKTLANPERDTFVILVDHEPAGALFFACENKEATISLYLLQPFTGRNLGSAIINQSCQYLFDRRPEIDGILAEILDANPPSLSAFSKAGFEPHATDDNTTILRRPRPQASIEIPHNRPSWDEAEEVAAADAAASGRWVNGPWTKALEDRLKKTAGGNWTSTSSGIAALRLSLQALSIGPGDEVIVPAYSCVALPNAVLAVGAKPVPVDIDDDFNIATAAVLNAVSGKTKAIIAVHTFGIPADIDALKKSHLPVIEDGSHGFPTSDNRWDIQGDLAILSFYATKLFGCGQGGAVMTRSEEQLDRVRDLSSYADKEASPYRDNLGLSEMEAAIAYRQLDKQTHFLSRRRELSQIYLSQFATPSRESTGIFYRFTLTLPNEETLQVLQNHLAENGITAERPVELWNDNPSAAQAYQTTLSLPLFPTLSDADATKVSQLISDFLSHV